MFVRCSLLKLVRRFKSRQFLILFSLGILDISSFNNIFAFDIFFLE